MAGVSKKVPLPVFRRIMDKVGWITATDVARGSGLTQPTAHNIIFGEVMPSLQNLAAICRKAGEPPEQVMVELLRFRLDNHAPM